MWFARYRYVGLHLTTTPVWLKNALLCSHRQEPDQPALWWQILLDYIKQCRFHCFTLLMPRKLMLILAIEHSDTHLVLLRRQSRACAMQQGGGLLPEVEAFEGFHERHGSTGGWHPDDHSEFERILKACRGDYSHATLMCYDHMIGFKRADIIAHARWAAHGLD